MRNLLDFLFTCFMVGILGIGFLVAYALVMGSVLGILIGVGWLMNP